MYHSQLHLTTEKWGRLLSGSLRLSGLIFFSILAAVKSCQHWSLSVQTKLVDCSGTMRSCTLSLCVVFNTRFYLSLVYNLWCNQPVVSELVTTGGNRRTCSASTVADFLCRFEQGRNCVVSKKEKTSNKQKKTSAYSTIRTIAALQPLPCFLFTTCTDPFS